MNMQHNSFLSALEQDIQTVASEKDVSFILEGPWKKFVKERNGFRIYAVDGRWVRRNLSVLFRHGGHALVHEFIPHGEIWIETHHYNEGEGDNLQCPCTYNSLERPVSQAFFESTTLHEIHEHNLMKQGMHYAEAHQSALDAEVNAGLLKDPYGDEN